MASDPSTDDSKSNGVIITGQWTTKPGPNKDVSGKETSIIWQPMYLLNGMDKLITTSGVGNGEWFQFRESGYYKIEVMIGLIIESSSDWAWIRVRDSKEKKVKAFAVTGKGCYATASGSFILKVEKNYSIKMTYESAKLYTEMNNDYCDGILNTILITKIS